MESFSPISNRAKELAKMYAEIQDAESKENNNQKENIIYIVDRQEPNIKNLVVLAVCYGLTIVLLAFLGFLIIGLPTG